VIAKFFIERPVLANVIALLTMLLGFVAIFTLPVSQYPPITPPTVQVTTRYPGANARTLINTVALPIEQQVNGVQDMLYMQSTSTNDGNYTLTVTFKVGTDLDFAQVLVQNRVAAALASLPDAVQNNGVVTKKKSTAILQIITLTSDEPRFDSLFLSNYASLRMRDELARLPGVGDVNVFGIGQYSMRIWLNPQQLLARSLSPSDVINAIRHQSQEVAAGQVGTPPAAPGQDFQLTVNVAGALNEVAQFEDIIVKSDSAAGASSSAHKPTASHSPWTAGPPLASRSFSCRRRMRSMSLSRCRPRCSGCRKIFPRDSSTAFRSTPRNSSPPPFTRCTARCSKPGCWCWR